MTTYTVNLPPLPEPFHQFHKWTEPRATSEIYTAEQMRAYALSYGRAVQEACAMVCDSLADETGYGDATDFIAGEFAGARNCAAAIRNGVIREGEGE